MKKTVTGTGGSVLVEVESQDVKLVRGTAIAGCDGRCEFALMVRA
jgi:hypothetical protein